MNKLNQVKLIELTGLYAVLFFMYRAVPIGAEYLHGVISTLLLATIGLIGLRGLQLLRRF